MSTWLIILIMLLGTLTVIIGMWPPFIASTGTPQISLNLLHILAHEKNKKETGAVLSSSWQQSITFP